MTQTKSSKKSFNMQHEWLKLSPVEQEKVTNFFNAHNLAHFLYAISEDETKKYITCCIRMNQIADKSEEKIEKEEKKEL